MLNDVAELGVDVDGADAAIAPVLEPGDGRQSLATSGVDDQGCRDLLAALQQDTCSGDHQI